MRAFIVITTNPGKSREIAQQVASLPGVRMADPCWGSPDVLAVIEFIESQTLKKLVMDKIQRLEGVTETDTYIAIE
jgi:DNA-binding Lrp family transcriptional regulator